MQCYGGSIPSGSSIADMTAAWLDSASTLQSASNIAYSSLTLSNAPVIATTITFTKRFSTTGCKALYSFAVTTSTALTSSARFYFTFHMATSSYLDNEGVV
jgi:hypothetical protein